MSEDTINSHIHALVHFSRQLSPNERDNLKYLLSIAAVNHLEHDFKVSKYPNKAQRFFEILQCIVQIHPYHERVQDYGVVYRGRPDFITSALVQELCAESLAYRSQSVINYNQYIAHPYKDSSTICNRLAESAALHELVAKYAGPCLPSHITSYIYYDLAGQQSLPHVDNIFSSITVMIGLRHECEEGVTPSSSSIVYWPNREPMEYRLQPGELAIFFGACVLHGRTPVAAGETVHSLLMSFRPVI